MEVSHFIIAALAASAGAAIAWLLACQRAAHAEAQLREVHHAEKLELSTKLATAATDSARVAELQREAEEKERTLAAARDAKAAAEQAAARLETRLAEERDQAAEKLVLLQDAQKQLTAQFESLSLQALHKSGEAFLNMARAQLGEFQTKATGDLAQRQQAISELLKPVHDSLTRVDQQIAGMEQARAGAYEGLIAQVRHLAEGQHQLRGETGRLVSALHSPVARGRWGEIQLRRVVELAGMQDHCDFFEQTSVNSGSGVLRPDLIVRMPGGKSIVLDSKAPFNAYYRAFEATDAASRAEAFREHALAVREHVKTLSAKSYWAQFDDTPEFVVLFLPGENFFSAALEHDPELIEFGANNRVILSTPTTLIALLRAVHYGWRHEKLAENARSISDLGRELYDRIATLGEHMVKLGRSLDTAVDSYNKAAGSLESRVLVTARRFKDLQAAPDKELKIVEQIEHTTRSIQAPELTAELPLEAPKP